MDCQNTNVNTVSYHIYCILSYDGGLNDTIINYTLLLVNLYAALYPFIYLSSRNDYSNITNSDGNNESKRCRQDWRKRGILATLAFIFVASFQIMLCLVVQCSGISIIWCAIGGWISMDFYYYRHTVERWTHDPAVYFLMHQIITILLDFIAIVYYAITMESITTLAHLLAIVVLGLPLHYMTEKLSTTRI